MSALSDAETEIRTWIDNRLPAIHDAAVTLEKVSRSPITAEVMALTAPLDPAVEQAIVILIRGAGEAAAKVAQDTEPPVPVGLDADQVTA